MPSKTARSAKRAIAQPKTRTTRSTTRHARTPEHEHVLDACDLKLSAAEATPDEDLPVAEGGVA